MLPARWSTRSWSDEGGLSRQPAPRDCHLLSRGALRQEESFGRASFLPLAGVLALGLIALAGCGSASVSDPDPPLTGAGSISGTVVDHSTSQPVGAAVVLLEQRDAGGIDRAVKSTTTAADGSFTASDLPAG